MIKAHAERWCDLRIGLVSGDLDALSVSAQLRALKDYAHAGD